MSGVWVMWVGRLLAHATNYCPMSLLILATKRLNQALGIGIIVPVLPSQSMASQFSSRRLRFPNPFLQFCNGLAGKGSKTYITDEFKTHLLLSIFFKNIPSLKVQFSAKLWSFHPKLLLCINLKKISRIQ